MIAVAPNEIYELARDLREFDDIMRVSSMTSIPNWSQASSKFRRGRVVRGAKRVAAHLLQFADAIVLHCIG